MKTAIKPSSRAPEITRVVSPEGTIICEKAGHQASAGPFDTLAAPPNRPPRTSGHIVTSRCVDVHLGGDTRVHELLDQRGVEVTGVEREQTDLIHGTSVAESFAGEAKHFGPEARRDEEAEFVFQPVHQGANGRDLPALFRP